MLLAACGQPTGLRDASVVNFSLSLAGTEADAQVIEAQGLPFDPATGDTSIELVVITVRDSANEVISFSMENEVYTADPEGHANAVVLFRTPSGISSIDVVLPAIGNPYTFESMAFSDMSNTVIAYAEQSLSVTDGGTVWIKPVAVLGAASLAPRYPTTYLTPDTVLDLMLVVAANGHDDIAGGDYLQVPLGDFVASYDAPSGASIVSQSNRGLRLQVDAQCSAPITVSGSVAGLVEVSGEFLPGSKIMNDGGLELECSPINDGTVSLDTEAPSVSVTSFNSSTGLVVGQANDNYGIAKVQVFDGPALLASTDDAEVNGAVSLIVFLNGTTEFRSYLTTTPQGGIRAVAFDASGNQTTTAETFNAQYVVVDAAAGPDGTGTEDSPLASIQAALEVVADGGIIFVRDGMYLQPSGVNQYIDVNKSVTILGESRDSTVIDALGNANAAYGMRIMANDVTVENLTVLGPDHPNTTGRGIFVQYGPGASATGNTGFALRNVFLTGASNHGVSFTGVRNALIDDVLVANTQGGLGIGFNLKASTDLLLQDVTTAGNRVGINISSAKASDSYPISDASNITISNWDPSESPALSTEVYTPRVASDISVPGVSYAVMGGLCAPYVYYVGDIVTATAVATSMCGNDAVIRGVTSTDVTELGAYFVEAGMSVQAAVDHAAAGSSINLASSTDFTAQGAITLPASKPFITLGGNWASIDSLVIAANGATVSNLRVQRNATGQGAGIEVSAQDVTLDTFSVENLAFTTASDSDTLGYGILIPQGANASGFTARFFSLMNLTYGLFVDNSIGTTTFSGASITNFDLTDITWKGLYFEALDDSVIRGAYLSNVGWYGGWAGTSQVGQWGTGIDINLKFGDYSDILLEGISAANVGWSFGTGTDAAPTTGARGYSSDPNGAVIAVRARNDGGYASHAATLTGLTIDGMYVTDSLVGVRIGEPNQDNEHTDVVLRNSTITAPVYDWSSLALPYAVVNASISDVDATDGNVFNGAIYDGLDDTSRGIVIITP